MRREWIFVVGLALLAAACSSSSSETTGGTLLTTNGPTTSPAPSTTTTVPATTTVSTTTLPPATTTTTSATVVAGTDGGEADVAAAGEGNTADTLVQLPFTGAEPGVTAAALLALIIGVWLVQRSDVWQARMTRAESRHWRRPGAPSADPVVLPPWPPNAVAPVTAADRQFRLRARQLANRYGISFLIGVDAYATQWAQSADLSEPAKGDDPVSRWKAHLGNELARIYRIE